MLLHPQRGYIPQLECVSRAWAAGASDHNAQITKHWPPLDLPRGVGLHEGGPTSLFWVVLAQPPGARLGAPTPGLAPGSGPSKANPGDVTVLIFDFLNHFKPLE